MNMKHVEAQTNTHEELLKENAELKAKIEHHKAERFRLTVALTAVVKQRASELGNLYDNLTCPAWRALNEIDGPD